jgi:hypothetical protein
MRSVRRLESSRKILEQNQTKVNNKTASEAMTRRTSLFRTARLESGTRLSLYYFATILTGFVPSKFKGHSAGEELIYAFLSL